MWRLINQANAFMKIGWFRRTCRMLVAKHKFPLFWMPGGKRNITYSQSPTTSTCGYSHNHQQPQQQPTCGHSHNHQQPQQQPTCTVIKPPTTSTSTSYRINVWIFITVTILNDANLLSLVAFIRMHVDIPRTFSVLPF